MLRAKAVVVAAALVAAFVLGALLGGHPNSASAQEPQPQANTEPTTDATVDVRALAQPISVVAAVPYQSRTDYEQDPFDPVKLRRTNTTVTKVMIVKADGTVEVREAP